MNRIDKIKKCVEGVVPWHTNWTDTDVEDVKHLISKLEQALLVLSFIAEEEQVGDAKLIHPSKVTAQIALEQLRE